MSEGMLYLSAADVQACELTPADINDAVAGAFAAAARGEAETRAALTIPAGGRASFRAKGGVLRAAGFGAVKWYGYFPGNAAVGDAEYKPLLILNESGRGYPVAIMNGDWITEVRTAAITALGASYLARPGACRVAFIGCGAQARANLRALQAVCTVDSAVACGRRPETAAAFAAFGRDHGVTIDITDDPSRALADADIVVTAIPRLASTTHFLDAAWVAPGAFVSMVDSGAAWQSGALPHFDRRFTDDIAQSGHAEPGDAAAEYHGSLTDLAGGRVPGRLTGNDRIALSFSGTGLADAAAAVAVYERALQKQLGLRLTG